MITGRRRDGITEVDRQLLRVRFERQGGLLVAKPTRKVRPLRRATVHRTRERLGEDRGRR